MARHHVRDNNGDLHFFNDEEYKQYRYRNGCLGVLALLIFVIGGIVSTCNDDGIISSSKTEGAVNTEVQNSRNEGNDDADMNMLINEQIEAEEVDNIETQNIIEEKEDNNNSSLKIQDMA